MPDLTVAELSRRYKVARSTMARALSGGRTGQPGSAVPKPVNPGEPQLRYRSEEVEAWWPTRRSSGRPPAPENAAAGRGDAK